MTHATPPLSSTIADIKALIHRESRRVTSYDVAIAAGVSQSAVSRCFKPGASVSKATYARVMQAAIDLDYTPNAAARSLNTRRSNLVALIASDLLHLHSPELFAELSRQFALRGMRIVLFSQPRETAPGSLSEVWEHQLDGAIVAASLSDQQLAEFERRGLPYVLFNVSVHDKNVNAIVCDQVGAARTMVARLAAAGNKDFAMIDGPAGSAMAQQRQRGVAERLAELGLAAPLSVNGDHDYASGARGLRDIVARLGRAPDVIICGNDAMAIGCLDTARHELGLDVPGQLSVTGFDGMAPAGWLSYNLTTLRQPVRQMAQATADMLAGLIGAGNTGSERRVFSASIIEGGTARLGPATWVNGVRSAGSDPASLRPKLLSESPASCSSRRRASARSARGCRRGIRPWPAHRRPTAAG
jgi:DNA-binding LacI/PurR family transcriptional regulator